MNHVRFCSAIPCIGDKVQEGTFYFLSKSLVISIILGWEGWRLVPPRVPVLESNVMSGPEKIRSRGQWSHIVTDA